MQELLAQGIVNVTPDDWANCVRHVTESVETKFWELDGIMDDAQVDTVYPVHPSVIINLNDESESDSDFM